MVIKMKKTAVVYASKYGTTKRYAEWIAQALSCDIFEQGAIKAGRLKAYEVVIYGGGLYAGGVRGINLIRKNFDPADGRRWILFTCGLADPGDPDNAAHIREGLGKALEPRILRELQVFHLRGGIDYARLGVVHKAMMAMLHKTLSGKDRAALREEDRQMLDTYGTAVDFTDRAAIEPILSYVRAL